MSAFVTALLVFCYPETKFSRQDVHDLHVKVPGKDVKQGSIDEKQVTSKRNSDGLSDDADAMYVHVRKGRPGKAQFAPMTKLEKNWLGFILRDLTTPILAFFNP